jgi:hypothetical protein
MDNIINDIKKKSQEKPGEEEKSKRDDITIEFSELEIESRDEEKPEPEEKVQGYTIMTKKMKYSLLFI